MKENQGCLECLGLHGRPVSVSKMFKVAVIIQAEPFFISSFTWMINIEWWLDFLNAKSLTMFLQTFYSWPGTV